MQAIDSLTELDFDAIVTGIRHDDPAAGEALYRFFLMAPLSRVKRQIGSQDLYDILHSAFIDALQSIRRGGTVLRDPRCLPGWVKTIVQRAVISHIEKMQVNRPILSLSNPETLQAPDRRDNPERALYLRQKSELIEQSSAGLRPVEREILHRFYVLEEPWPEIAKSMGLTATQFRLLKSRAKARMAKAGRQNLSHPLPKKAVAA